MSVVPQELADLLAQERDVLGPCSILPIANLGFIVSRSPLDPVHSSATLFLLFDLDDTVLATTRGKWLRFQAYGALLEKLGFHLTQHSLDQIEQYTYGFAIWEEGEGGGRVFHQDAQVLALAWVTELFENPKDSEEVMRKIERLLSLSAAKEKIGKYEELKQSKLTYLPYIEEIFSKTIFSPPLYEDFIDHLTTMGQGKNLSTSIPLAIFTYGDPLFQLRKVVELLKRVPELNVGEIWLTRVRKSQFFEAVLQHSPQEQLSVSPLASALLLERRPSVVVMIDDNIQELDALAHFSCTTLQQHCSAVLLLLHVRQLGAKTADIEWETRWPHTSLDLQHNAVTLPALFARWPYVSALLEMKEGELPDTAVLQSLFQEMVKALEAQVEVAPQLIVVCEVGCGKSGQT